MKLTIFSLYEGFRCKNQLGVALYLGFYAVYASDGGFICVQKKKSIEHVCIYKKASFKKQFYPFYLVPKNRGVLLSHNVLASWVVGKYSAVHLK